MIKPIPFLLFALIFSCVFLPQPVLPADETITISTYYPAPYGIYKELRAQRVAIGENYINNAQYCWAPNTCTNQFNASADLVVEGNAGIGRIDSTYALDVKFLSLASGSPGRLSLNGWGKALRLSAQSALVWEQSYGNNFFMAFPSTDPLSSTAAPNKFYAGFVDTDDGTAGCDYVFRIQGLKDPPAFEGKFKSVQFFSDVIVDENVGIGTIRPQAKLDVVGVIRSKAATDFSKSVDLYANSGTGNFGGNQAILRLSGGATSGNDEIWIGPGGTIRHGFAGHVQVVANNIHLMTADDTNPVPTARDGMVEVSGGMNIHSNDSPVILPRLSADPPAAKSVDGAIYYNRVTRKFRGRANGAWQDL